MTEWERPITLAERAKVILIGLRLKPHIRGGGIRRSVAARCAWLWRKKWLSKRQAEAVKRLALEGLS